MSGEYEKLKAIVLDMIREAKSFKFASEDDSSNVSFCDGEIYVMRNIDGSFRNVRFKNKIMLVYSPAAAIEIERCVNMLKAERNARELDALAKVVLAEMGL